MKTASRLAVAAVGTIGATLVLSAAAADFRTDSDARAAAPSTASTSTRTTTTPATTTPATTMLPAPTATAAGAARSDSNQLDPELAATVGPCTFTSGTRLDAAAAADPVADRHGGVGFDTAHCVTDPTGTAWAVAWNGAQPPVGGLFRFVPNATRWELLELGSLGDCVAAHGVPAEIATQLPGC